MDPVTQTSPTEGLPFGMPFTVHVTLVSAVLVIIGVKVARCETVIIIEAGEMTTGTALVTATVADALADAVVAWMVTELGEHISAGAV